MLKKIVGLAAALISFNASAGYIQYNFGDTPDAGFFVQHDDDKAIAFYMVRTPRGSFYSEPDGYIHNNLVSARNAFQGLGPTSFVASSWAAEDFSSKLSIDFSEGDTPGTFSYVMTVNTGPGPYAVRPGLPPASYSYLGTVTAGPVIPWFLAEMPASGGYYGDISRIVPAAGGPNQVPEPASLALLAVGALGAAAAVMRRRHAA